MTEYTVRIHEDGAEYWLNKDGRMHRENGPARLYANGREEYYINGKELTKEEFELRGNPKHEGQVVTIDGVEYELRVGTRGTK